MTNKFAARIFQGFNIHFDEMQQSLMQLVRQPRDPDRADPLQEGHGQGKGLSSDSALIHNLSRTDCDSDNSSFVKLDRSSCSSALVEGTSASGLMEGDPGNDYKISYMSAIRCLEVATRCPMSEATRCL